MDLPNIAGVSSAMTMVLMVGYMIYKFTKHSRCRSICCGNKTEVQIDLEERLKTPPTPSI
jgi:hypothetical protein